MKKPFKKNPESVLREQVTNANQQLKEAVQNYRRELKANPDLVYDDDFCSNSAREIDGLQRDQIKYSQMLDLLIGEEGGTVLSEDSEAPLSCKQTIFDSLKSSVARAAKQGLATTMVKTISDEMMIALGDNCPDLILALPNNIRELALCSMFYLTAQSFPQIPMSDEAAAVAQTALEGMMAKVFAETSAVIAPKLVPMMKNIAAMKAASSVANLVTGGSDN